MPRANPRSAPRRKLRRKSRSLTPRLVLAGVAVVLTLFAWGALSRHFAPVSNSTLTRFDAIIVLGFPADSDGNPTPIQLARVTEAVREYERGIAPRIVFTGGAARNRVVEARVMAQTAQAQGVPASAIFIEPQAMDTIQNACYSVRIMKAHDWRSAEVVSNKWHLPRAALIFSRLPLDWRVHAAPPLSPESATDAGFASMIETLKTVRYLLWTRQTEHCEP